jgi:hypothetical protein
MRVTISWGDVAQSVILLEFKRGWTWGDLRAALQQADTMITSVEHTVHLIVDIRAAGGIPADFITQAGDMFAQGAARPNEGKKIIIGAGMMIRMAYRTFVSTFGSHMKNRPFLFADSMTEAQALMAQP